MYDKIKGILYTNAETNGKPFEAGPKTEIILTPPGTSESPDETKKDNDTSTDSGTGGNK